MRFFVVVLMHVLAYPVWGQGRPPAELDQAFEALRHAPDEQGAGLVEQRIRQLLAARFTPSVTLLMARGQRNLAANLPAEALEDFDAAIILAPEAVDPWFGRALAAHRAGDAPAALRDLQQVLQLEPRHWAALQQLSLWQEAAGDTAGAWRSFEAALAIHPRLHGGEVRLRELRRKALGDAA